MAKLIPFKGLRYNLNIVGDISHVITPPYDIISQEAQENFYSLNPYSSIRLELPKELPEDDQYQNKYTRAGNTLKDWIQNDILLEEEKDCFYIYQQEFSLSNGKSYTRTGFIGLVKLEEFEKGIVLPHENTLSKPKADRIQLMRTCDSNFSQVFGLYDDTTGDLPARIRNYCKNNEPCIYTNKGIDNNSEGIWAVCDHDLIESIKANLKDKQLYIADGHHRYETALSYRNELRANNPNHSGKELYNYVMMTIIEMADPGLVILPTHRMVNDIEDYDRERFLNGLKEYFYIQEYGLEDNKIHSKARIVQDILNRGGSHTLVFYEADNKPILSLTLKSIDIMERFLPNRDSSYSDLDVSILHTLILENLLGIDEKKLANQENLEYTHSIEEGVEGVDSGAWQMSFFISATTIKQIQKISLANEKMPQKSTYFYPKLTTGLVFNKFR